MGLSPHLFTISKYPESAPAEWRGAPLMPRRRGMARQPSLAAVYRNTNQCVSLEIRDTLFY
ncbi:MAG: hypothetical protein HPY85_08730 [Anaerolineae bacterium]|nr:hypothetical protein [Anaerolineae bacterium]